MVRHRSVTFMHPGREKVGDDPGPPLEDIAHWVLARDFLQAAAVRPAVAELK